MSETPQTAQAEQAALDEVGGGVQAVYGAKAVLYKSAINAQLGIDD